MSPQGVSFGSWRIPEDALHETFTTTGGPGGQHANRNETGVVLKLDLTEAPLPETTRNRLIERLGATDITVVASDSRSQWRNRALARRRMTTILEDALKPTKKRKKTNPTRAAQRRRLDEKRRRSQVKKNRKPPTEW
jgi:ribosome-associated protein